MLKAFMGVANGQGDLTMGWLVGIHLSFVASGVSLALMDWLACQAAAAHGPMDRH